MLSGLDNIEWTDAAIRLESLLSIEGNTDSVEGRGASYTIGYAKSLTAAKDIAKGRGPMGSDAVIREANVLRISFTGIDGNAQDVCVALNAVKPFDHKAHRKAEVMEKALAKLTEEERKVLGV
jgi:hypothetical protein